METKLIDCIYTHNDSIKINIGKLKVYHIDDSIEYLYQEGRNFDLDWINRKNSICTVDFGDYKDESILDVVIKDPAYILWCIINLNHFLISKELLDVLLDDTDNATDNLKEAVELNLIKLQLIDTYRDYVEEMIETDWELKHNNDDYKTELNEKN